MPNLNYTLPYQINSNLAISANELRDIYLFGINFTDEFGNPYSDQNLEYHILNAQESLEDLLNIKFKPQVIQETLNYDMRRYGQWCYLRTSYPVRKGFSLKGYVGTTSQINYPASWLTSRRTNDPIGWERQLNLVPSGQDSVSFSEQAIFSTSYMGAFYGSTDIPEYFEVTYTTGFDVLPRDILDTVGKIASIGALNVMGDIGSLGSGIASKSISIDGLSQSQSSTASATSAANTARILQYKKELDSELKDLKGKYRGIGFTSL